MEKQMKHPSRWKRLPLWFQWAIALPAMVMALFLVGGITVSITHHAACTTPPASASTGYMPMTLGGCFGMHNNPMMLLLTLPVRAIFWSTSMMSSFYNNWISIAFQSSSSQLVEYLVVNLILYFLAGAAIGLLIHTLRKRQSKGLYSSNR